MSRTRRLTLPAEEVHAWTFLYNGRPEIPGLLDGLLSDEERLRSDRYHFGRDRRRFIFRRAKLKLTLSYYLAVEPMQVRYRANAFGKLELDASPGPAPLRFSTSHSGDCALVAVARERDVGVDVEEVRRMPDLAQLAETVLSERERAVFRSLPEVDGLAAFLSAWTQKEAYLKGRGVGLSRPPDEIEVGLPPAQNAGLRRDRADPTAARAWSLRAWEPAPGYTAALAAQGDDWRLIPRDEERS